jgi:hypothetical protein
MDLVGVTCSGRLHRRTPLGDHAWRLLDRMGFGRVHPCFYLTIWFQRERCEALLAVTIMRRDSRSMVKKSSGECHGCRVLKNCIGGLSLCGKEELAS